MKNTELGFLSNNLKIEPPHGVDKQTYLREKIYPLFYKVSNDFELSSILSQLTRDNAMMFSKFHSKTKVLSAKLLNSFEDILGDDWIETYGWKNINDREHQPKKKTSISYSYEDIWHVLNTFDGQENLKRFAIDKLKLDEEKAEKFSKIKLIGGYATLSLSAIKKILPFLQKGFLYSQAVYLANLYKVLGAGKITEDLIEYFAKEVQIIIDNNKEQKTINNIVNNLIGDELNDEHRYSIDVERELDDSEKRQINKKIIDVFGEKSWNELEDGKQTEIVDYVSMHFKDFFEEIRFVKKIHFCTSTSFARPDI